MNLGDAFRKAAQAGGGESSDFDLNPQFKQKDRALTPAGVLVACLGPDDAPQLLLTKRSSHLKHHPGQIAFPGGKVDPGDDGPVGAALREAEEEVGLPQASVEVLGTLLPHETVTSFAMTPVLAWIKSDFDPKPEIGEVDEIFTVPLAHVLNPENYVIEGRIWLGARRNYYVVPYGPYYIWGATARILRRIAERVSI